MSDHHPTFSYSSIIGLGAPWFIVLRTTYTCCRMNLLQANKSLQHCWKVSRVLQETQYTSFPGFFTTPPSSMANRGTSRIHANNHQQQSYTKLYDDSNKRRLGSRICMPTQRWWSRQCKRLYNMFPIWTPTRTYSFFIYRRLHHWKSLLKSSLEMSSN